MSRSPPLSITSQSLYVQQCYDATWTLARALNSTINGNVQTFPHRCITNLISAFPRSQCARIVLINSKNSQRKCIHLWAGCIICRMLCLLHVRHKLVTWNLVLDMCWVKISIVATKESILSKIPFLLSQNLLRYLLDWHFFPTCTDIADDSGLNQKLKQYQENSETDVNFALQHFTYNNSGVLDLIFGHLNRTSFNGITVSTQQ